MAVVAEGEAVQAEEAEEAASPEREAEEEADLHSKRALAYRTGMILRA
jgi:hypothetical protein